MPTPAPIETPPCFACGATHPTPATADDLATAARGLAHPARIEVVRLLEDGQPHTTGDIVGRSGLAASTVSEHLRILRDTGIVCAKRDGPRIWYCLDRGLLRWLADQLTRLAAAPPIQDQAQGQGQAQAQGQAQGGPGGHGT